MCKVPRCNALSDNVVVVILFLIIFFSKVLELDVQCAKKSPWKKEIVYEKTSMVHRGFGVWSCT